MTALDSQDVFASGPSEVRPGAWERSLLRRGLAGIDGELILDLGLRSRPIVQTGRLQADTASELHSQIAQIESFVDGSAHILTDNHGLEYTRVVVESFEPATPIRKGRGFWCEYRIAYRQLP